MELDVDVFHRASIDSIKMEKLPANLLDFGMYRRLVYQEEDGAEVVLDLFEDEVSLVRRGEAVTQAFFSLKEESFLEVHNEHGTLSFQVEIKDLIQTENSLRILYALYHQENHVSENDYECEWNGGD